MTFAAVSDPLGRGIGWGNQFSKDAEGQSSLANRSPHPAFGYPLSKREGKESCLLLLF